MKKGILDALVLSILKNRDTYGYELVAEASKYVEVAETALYPVLKRLMGQGLLETYSSEHNGRLRKYYRITGTGLEKLKEYTDALVELKEVIDLIIDLAASRQGVEHNDEET